MSRVRSKDTGPELALRSALHRRGLRFRKNVRGLPGTPDILFPGPRVAVFVDGDFWHGRDFAAKSVRLSLYWKTKIARNMERDRQDAATLEGLGYCVVRVWGSEVNKDLKATCDLVERAVRRGVGSKTLPTIIS